MPAWRNANAADEITEFADGAGPPANRIATRFIDELAMGSIEFQKIVYSIYKAGF
jgi:hypothetical protein